MLMGTQSENQFRAEIRDANNEVKGVYSWLDASGNEHTVVFNSGKDGYKIMPLEESGIELPPFPYGLYGDKPEEIQARTLKKSVDCIEPGSLLCDDMVVIGLEEDIIPKLENDADSITTTTEDPVDAEITEKEKTQILQNSEVMEFTRPLESLEAEPVKEKHTVASEVLQYDTKPEAPQVNLINENNKESRVPKFLIFPLVADYYQNDGSPIQYPLGLKTQYLRPQILQPLYLMFNKKKYKRSP